MSALSRALHRFGVFSDPIALMRDFDTEFERMRNEVERLKACPMTFSINGWQNLEAGLTWIEERGVTAFTFTMIARDASAAFFTFTNDADAALFKLRFG